MSAELPPWVTVLSALLTPTVAGVAVYIAWRQWRLADRRLRLDLFDKRFVVYAGAREFIKAIVQKGDATDEDIRQFLLQTMDAPLLFSDGQVHDFLDKMYRNALELHVHQIQSVDRSNAELQNISIGKHTKLLEWFLDASNRLPKVSANDLALK